MKNILTFDIEDWYQTSDFNIDTSLWDNYESRVYQNTIKILDLLDKYDVKATFFILGYTALKEPELVKEISNRGHEIGSHGYYHKMVSEMTEEEFREDLKKSLQLIGMLIDKPVKYYRAPSWSISSNNLWPIDIMLQEGIICDSSMQPFKTYLSGDSKLPTSAFIPVINGIQKNIVEIPSTTYHFANLNIPFAGGAYLRFFPKFLIKKMLKRTNKNRAGMVYIHPWEIDSNQPKIKCSLLTKIIHYTNTSTTLKKLEMLLNNFEFVTLGTYIKDNNFKKISI